MPELGLKDFEQYLLRAGVTPKNARRSTLEIGDHFEDLRLDALASGISASEANAIALQRIGSLQAIAEDMASRPELRCWVHRYPLAASLVLPIAYVALLPTTPIFAGVAKAPQIARWGACLMLGAIVTAAMFLAMQTAIALG